MPKRKHDIDFLRGSVQDIQDFLNRSDLSESEFCHQLEAALKLADNIVVWAAKRTLAFSTESSLGSTKRARDRWEDESAFKRFFGRAPKNKQGFNAMERRFRKLETRMKRGLRIRVRPHTSGPTGNCTRSDKSAYVSRISSSLSLNICPKFFVVGNVDGDGIERQAAIIVHEMVHKLGLIGKTHKQEFKGKMKQFFEQAERFATNEPNKARRNPDSYEAFAGFVALHRLN